MEHIMLHLGTTDVLKAMQATRAMRDTVNGSSKIQMSIGLLPNPDADFLALPWPGYYPNRFHGFEYDDYSKRYCCSYDSRYDDIQEGAIPDPRKLEKADFLVLSHSGTALYKLGSRCRGLSICQPPVLAMKIHELCKHCEAYDPTPNPAGELKPSNGAYITMGDLYSATIRTRTAHRRKCKMPKAKADIRVEFRGSVLLRQSDPIMVLRQQKEYAKEHYGYWDWDNDSDSADRDNRSDDWDLISEDWDLDNWSD
ncbi:hypothetical protein LTR65_001898 [Meristemomyces frigidus]